MPDGILVEATTDFPSAISTVQMLRGTDLHAHILVIGLSDDDASVFDAISAGADGYLPARSSAEALMATLEGVIRGELGLSRATGLRVVQQLRRAVHSLQTDVPVDLQDRLTRREREVFQLVRSGMRSREIAAQLSIAEATVYKHIQNILEKLQVHSRRQAAFLAELDPSSGMSNLNSGPRGSASSTS